MSVEINEVQGLCADVEYVVLGELHNNTYIISDSVGTMVVDPSCDVEAILEALDGRAVDTIFITHYHHDHVGAANALKEATGARVVASAIDAPHVEDPSSAPALRAVPGTKVDGCVSNGDVMRVGNMKWKIIETPGHSRGSICAFLIPQFCNHVDGLPILITGDTLFAGTTGRTDFFGGSVEDMRASMKKLAALPDDTVVLPGHGKLTTIKDERLRTFAQWA